MKALATFAALPLVVGLAWTQDDTATSKPDNPQITLQVIESRRINLGNRSLILNHIVPPILPQRPPPPPPPSPEEIAAAEAAAPPEPPPKRHEVLFLAATVYDHKLTEIHWSGSKGNYTAFSNIDFNLLAGLSGFETDDTEYMLMASVANQTSEQREAFHQLALAQGEPASPQMPPLEAFSSTRAEYLMVEDKHNTAPTEGELRALDALHLYYDANKQRIASELAQRRAAYAERTQ